MYVPAAFAEVDPREIERLVTEYLMAQLVTMTEDGLVATPMPLLYEPAPDGLGSLVGHVARANRQWAKSSSTVEALAIFTGPNAYISPNWYASKAEHGKVVPTWNYETVHIRGHFVAHDDPAWTRALVARLTQRHESQFAAPWSRRSSASRCRSRRSRPSASTARTGRPSTWSVRSPAWMPSADDRPQCP